MRSKVTPRKVGVGLKRRREPSRRRLAWWGSTEKKEASHLLGLRGRHQSSDQCSNRNRAPCVASTAVGTEGGGSNGQIVSVKRAADGTRQRTRKIINEYKEKYRANYGSLRNTSTDSKGTAFVILINHTSAPVRKERLSPTSKPRREASQNELMKRAGCQTESKAFEKSIVERIVREPGLGLLNPSEMD